MTLEEMQRILDIASENEGLKLQLDKLRQTWMLVDSDYVSLMAQRKALNDEYDNLQKRLGEIKLEFNKVDSQILTYQDKFNDKTAVAINFITAAKPSRMIHKYGVQQYASNSTIDYEKDIGEVDDDY